MGCTGSKYQTLNAENPTRTDDSPTASPPPENGTSGDGATADAEPGAKTVEAEDEPTTPLATPPVPFTPALTPNTTPGTSRESEAPGYGAGARPQSAMPEYEPPLTENDGDEQIDLDTLDLDMTSENLEERFPPWKDNDKYRPTNSLNKSGPGSVQALPPSTPASSSSAVPHGSEEGAAPEKVANTAFDNTVIIFDWDDTLLCSSALHCCLPNQFVELEEIVETVLLMAMSLGRTIIVTNAMESWIQETTRRFLPRLMPTLERLLIVYARKNWERLWPGDTFAWKRESFREVLHDKLGSDLNLVVLGDSLSEIRAAEALAEHLGVAAIVKTVKFKALPSPTDLLGELRTIVPELSRLVEERHSASKELYQEPSNGGLFNSGVFQAAPSWQLLDAVPNEMFTPPPGVFAHQHLWSVTPPSPVPPTQITI